MEPPTEAERRLLAEVLRAVRMLRYGSIQIVVQDARVVQIETTEKRRLIE